MKSIAVLLTCHNRREKTLNCLKSVYGSNLPENHILDVFLVDDGSTDGTSEFVLKEFPEVNLIHGNGHLFWNRGMYLAWTTAIKVKEYNLYLWLNDDTRIFKDAIKLMIDYSQMSNNNRIVVGATCSEVTGNVTYSGFKLPAIKLIPNGNWQDCEFFNGNIVLIPSYIYRQVGIIDKQFRHNLGDIDYGMRALKLGFVHSLSPFCLGICEDHEIDPPWRDSSISIFNRLKYLYSPLGNNPFEFFIFERRHNGLYLAIIRFFSNHLRAIRPSLWK